MGQHLNIPTRATVDAAWKRYSDLHCAIQADPAARQDPVMQRGLDRAHERFCKLYNQWSGR